MGRKYRADKRGVFRCISGRSRSVSVRMPPEIYDTVMRYEGATFSEKLVNLIFDYREFHGLKKQ